MFHVEHGPEVFDVVEEWLGLELDDGQRLALLRYEQWLGDEAIPAGGIGPGEGDRLLDRHILDSLTFLAGFPEEVASAVDVGGGVGLPSIPLAIVRPETEFTLVDRSARRTDLAARAVRILGLENVGVEAKDVSALAPTFDVALFRASLPIQTAAMALNNCLQPLGTGLFAVSRHSDRPELPSAPEGITFSLSLEGDRVLASPFWLLKMRYS